MLPLLVLRSPARASKATSVVGTQHGVHTLYCTHTHTEHNQPHTANTKTQDVQETDTTRPVTLGSCAVGAAVLIVARQSVGLLPTASDFVQTCRNYPLVPL